MKLKKLITRYKKPIALSAVVLWAIAIFILSSFPAKESYRQSKTVLNYLDIFGAEVSNYEIRKFAHLASYFLLGILVYNLVRIYRKNHRIATKVTLFVTGMYAISDEIHQYFVKGRDAKIFDVAIDIIGASIGMAITYSLWKIHEKRNHIKIAKPSAEELVESRIKFHKGTALTLMIMYIAFLIGLILLQVLPTNLLLLAGLVIGMVVGTLCYLLLKSKAKNFGKSAILTAISFIVIAVLALSTIFAFLTDSFISNIRGIEYEEFSYSIVTMEDRNMKLQSLASVGYLLTDPNNTEVLSKVDTKTKAKPKSFDDITALSQDLTKYRIDSIVIGEPQLQLLYDNYDDLEDDVTILYTFTIRAKRSGNQIYKDITQPFAVYISGIDTYGDITKNSRSDVNILAIVNPKTRNILLVNTPRDFYVQLHDTTGPKDKLTHAGIYGIDISKNTLADLYEVTVDYYVRINFNTLIDVVDALGGITVNSDYSFKLGKRQFNKGLNDLDGDDALAFSRARYGLKDGDRDRGKNQQKILEAIIKKITSPSIIMKYQNLLSSLEDTFQTNADNRVVTGLVKQQLEAIGQWNVESISVTGSDSKQSTYSMGARQLYVMIPDQSSVQSAKNKIQSVLQ